MNTRLPPTRNSIRNLSAEKIYEINHQQISPQKRTKFYFKLINMTAACFSILPLFTVLPNMRTPQQKILAYKKLLTYSRRLKPYMWNSSSATAQLKKHLFSKFDKGDFWFLFQNRIYYKRKLKYEQKITLMEAIDLCSLRTDHINILILNKNRR